MKKIDIHVHTIAEPGLLRPRGDTFATPEELFAMYAMLGVEKAVLLPILSPEGQFDGNTNREIMNIARRYPDRFYWFCNIDPRQGNNDTSTDFVAMLAYYRSCGAKGLGEITANLPMDDPRVEALLAACEKCGMPVTIHIGDLGGDYGLVDSLGLPKLEKLLQKYRFDNFVSEEEFENSVEAGNNWCPKYDYLLFKKSIDIEYSAERN